jgi:hypothetical protein
MKRINKIKQYKKIERALEQKYKGKQENEASLEKSDFRDGKLSISGYTRLKQQCEYIGYDKDIEIKVPMEYVENFKETLECLVTNELWYIKKDRRSIKMTALLLLAIGVLWYLVRYFFIHTVVVQEITLVATWVFVWAAVEKLFFDQKKLVDRRHRLLQILLAKITGRDEAEKCNFI